MKILIVNDDSIHAPGIEVLARAALELGEVTVVAPAHQCSAMAQQITIRGKLNVRRAEDFPVPVKAAWQVDGTPADCVRVAMHILEEKPDLVLSGINAGWNAGFDIVHSGTLGAAFEATLYGIPAIAFSNAHGAQLDPVEPHLVPILRELAQQAPPQGGVWNVNFPGGEPRGIRRGCQVAPAPLFREHYVSTPLADGSADYTLEGTPLAPGDPVPAGSDLEAVLDGYISIGSVRCAVL